MPAVVQDPWYNGPQRGYGRDEANSPGIALDSKAMQVRVPIGPVSSLASASCTDDECMTCPPPASPSI